MDTRDGCMCRAFRAKKARALVRRLESNSRPSAGVPEEVLMDNTRALVARHDAVSRTVPFNDKLIAFAKHWGSPSSRLRAVSGPHEGQDGEWRGLREEERDRGAFHRELGGIRGAPRRQGARARARGDPRRLHAQVHHGDDTGRRPRQGHGERRLDEKLLALGKPKLLIVDERGYLSLEPDAAHLFFQLVSRRY